MVDARFVLFEGLARARKSGGLNRHLIGSVDKSRNGFDPSKSQRAILPTKE